MSSVRVLALKAIAVERLFHRDAFATLIITSCLGNVVSSGCKFVISLQGASAQNSLLD